MGKNKNKDKGVMEKIADKVESIIHPTPDAGPEKVEDQPAADAEKPADYHEHQAKWESKAEREKRDRELAKRKDQADLAKHPKFDKFKSHGEN